MQFARSMLVLLASPNYAYNDPINEPNRQYKSEKKTDLWCADKRMVGDSAAMLIPYFSEMYCLLFDRIHKITADP